jgi:hypothetical protein
MAEQSDIRKALESIVGHELSDEAFQRIWLSQIIASYTQSNTPGEALVTNQRQVFPFTKTCDRVELLDVSGFWTTGSDGKVVLRLSDFICFMPPGDDWYFDSFVAPINVIATPLSAQPYFLTVLHTFVKNSKGHNVDVEIRVFAWDANGKAAKNIDFDWRCRVGFPTIIL